MQKLTTDPRVLLLERADPIEVLQWCQTDTKMAKVCSKPGTFEKLLDLHYPEWRDMKENDAEAWEEDYADLSARELYTRWASDEGSYWLLDIESIPEDEQKAAGAFVTVGLDARYIRKEEMFELNNVVRLEHQKTLNVRGGTIPRGLHTVVLYIQGRDVVKLDYFETLDDAIDAFILTQLDRLRARLLDEYGRQPNALLHVEKNRHPTGNREKDIQQKEELLNDYIFGDRLPYLGYPDMRDEEAVRAFIEEKGAFYADYLKQAWMFVEVDFQAP